MSNSSLHTLHCNNTLEANISLQAGHNQSCENDPFKHYYEYQEFRVFQFLWKYAYYFHTVPGIPLNLLCIIVVALMKPHNSSRVFMLVLGCTDLIGVICRLVHDLVDSASSILLCKCFRYIYISSIVYSNYVLICFTIERVLVTAMPLKSAQICTIRNTVISLTVSLIVCFSLNIPYLTGSFIINLNSSSPAVCTLTGFTGNIWVKVYGAYHSLIPLIVVALCNAVILFNVKKSQKRKRELTNRTTSGASGQHSITRTLLVLSFVFAILHAPYALFNLIVPDYPTPEEIPFFDQHLMARLLLTGTSLYQLMCLQNTINFILYCCCAANFRNAFCQVLLALRNHVTNPVWLTVTGCVSRCRTITEAYTGTTAPSQGTNSSSQETNISNVTQGNGQEEYQFRP